MSCHGTLKLKNLRYFVLKTKNFLTLMRNGEFLKFTIQKLFSKIIESPKFILKSSNLRLKSIANNDNL